MIESLESRRLLSSNSLSTVPNTTSITLGSGNQTLSDTATLILDSTNATGTITFTLKFGSTTVAGPYVVSVNGAGSYPSPSYTLPSTGASVGVYQWNAVYSGDIHNAGISDVNNPGERVLVKSANPSIVTTQQPASAVIGSVISDKATVSGGYNPTGTVTFRLYNNPNGTGTPLFTDTENLVNGVATSAGYTAAATGTDYWIATYNGDSKNNAVTSGSADEPVSVTPANPAIVTIQQPASAVVGSVVADKATVTGGYNPTGTVTFRLYDNPNGTGTPLFTDTEALINGVATSAGYTTTLAGIDYWVATYNGDANNASVTAGTALEPVTISPATPSIVTSQQPATAVVGSVIADQATVSGGYNPTGTVTFNLYDNPNGLGIPLFTDTESLVNGVATSAGYTVTTTGTDYWVATYNGDVNNVSVTSQTADEPVTSTPSTPVIVTNQQPATAIVGSLIADQAIVSGGYNPTGTVTFRLYDNPNGTGTPLFTDTENLVSGVATSAGYTATATGTEYWVATYNGDSNNSPVQSGAADEPVIVSPSTPLIVTSQQPATAIVGGLIADQATVSGGYNPTGTVTFRLYDNPNGTGTPLFTDTELMVNGVATSAGYAAVATGTDYWIATYNGDANNVSVISGAADEPVVISPASPAIVTIQQPATAVVGSIVADKATVTGGYSPTGTVTFNLYDNPNGTGTPLFTDTETLVNGVATSAGYTATATGTSYWVATYNGDANNNAVTAGAALEPVIISPSTPAIITSQQPATAVVGSMIADKAFVSGGYNPTGTITFRLYDNPDGIGTPLFTDTEALIGGVATSAGYTATATGTDYWVATYNGDSNNSSITSAGAEEPVSITPATPSIVTSQQPATATVGGTFADQATVSGGYNPTGTVTFRLYNNPNGTGAPLFTDTEALVNGVATSAGYTATATGTEYWIATYNGDANNVSVVSGAADEPVVITPSTPSIVTSQQPATVVVGGSIADQATVSGGYNPTGTVTFRLYNNPNGTGAPLFTDTEALVNGVATSAGYTATATGTEYWIATYNGDANNVSVVSGAADEPVVITPSTPSIVTSQQPATIVVGGSIADQATVSGGYNPTGTVTFRLYNNPNGTGTPLFTDTEALVNGVATSAGYTATATGTEYWIATYNGDANNVSVVSGAADEPVVITPSAPAIVTTQMPATVIVGGTISDKAIVSGGYNPTGTVTFRLYNNPNGTGTPLFTDTEALVGGVAISAGYTATATGTDYWIATYNGDSNNSSVVSGKADEPVMITPSTPTIVTSQMPATVIVGGTISDKAIVSGGYNPTGTVTFRLYNNPNGTGTPLFTDTEALVGGVAISAGYTATATGTDYWIATYNGDSNNSSVVSGKADEPVVITPSAPAIVTTPSVTSITLGSTAPNFKDTAKLTGGYNLTGTITFTLVSPSNVIVDTEVVTVTGAGTYSTPTGYTLPTSGTVTGTYQWNAVYSGDANNGVASDKNNPGERIVVNPGCPTISTTPNVTSVNLGGTFPTLKDTATLTGGYYDTGTITFTLVSPSGTIVDTEVVTVTGAGIYTTPKGYTLPSNCTVTGTYQWNAVYSGDGNNNGAIDKNNPGERVVVSPTGPSIVTTPSATCITLGTTAPTLKDTAKLAGGYSLTGTITFTLVSPSNVIVDTEVVTVTGAGTYSTPSGYTLPTTGTVTGTYQWNAVYSGDGNNAGASDKNNVNERVAVSPACPSLSTKPNVTSVTLGSSSTVLKDTATLSGGYYEKGTITFTLYLGTTKLDTETVTVNGNGTYTTPTGFTLPASCGVAGTYQWNAVYSGDSNNNSVSDLNNPNERVVVGGASISGTKFLDISGNGFSADDTPLAGASFSLYLDSNHDNILNDGAAVATMKSGADGTFSFTNLPAGTYFLKENPLAGYIQTGPSLLPYYTINVTAGSTNTGYNFDDAPTGCPCDVTNITYTITGPGICGTKTVTDLRGNAFSGDVVTVTFNVTEAGGTLSLVSYTAPGAVFDANTANQQAIFQVATLTNATLGYHTLTVVIPNCDYQIDFVCGPPIDKFGPAGSNIFYTPQGRLYSADNGGTQLCTTSSLSGYVYNDCDNDGVKDTGEAAMSGVTVKLSGTDIYGKAVAVTTTTNTLGYYIFTGLNASNAAGYTITETTPSGYLDGKDVAGSLGGTAGNDFVKSILINTNSAGVNYNFGELASASLSGYVFVDSNNDCNRSGEAGIANVVVTLTGTDDRGNAVSLTTKTDSTGKYSFAGLRPGTYTITETTPTGYTDGKNSAGSAGGTASLGKVVGIVLKQGVNGTEYNFGERKKL